MGKNDNIIIRNSSINDLPAIVEIYNQAIIEKNSTADLSPFTTTDKQEWYSQHNDSYPILVAESNGIVVGWISISPYRKGREALKYTVEVSYYIHKEYRGKGIGDKLLKSILVESKEIGYKTIFAIIFETNIPSIKLLKKNNFEKWGLLKDVVEIDGKIISHLYFGRKL